MSNTPTANKPIFENLVRHMAEIEDDKAKFIEEYVYRSSQDRDKLRDFFDHYTSVIEKFAGTISKDDADITPPFVIIGSLVQVQDLANGNIIDLRVINPLRDEVGFDDVSCLSPVGKALLLKKVGDSVSINTPGGVITYKIESIKYNG